MGSKKIRTKNLVKNLEINRSGEVFRHNTNRGVVPVGKIVWKLKLVAKWLGRLGLVMMVTAVMGLVFVYIPLGIAEIKFTVANSQLGRSVRRWDKEVKSGLFAVDIPTSSKSKFTPVEKPDWEVPDIKYSIYIPKIMALSRVISDVNAGNEKEYKEALKMGVAEAAGLAHPGEKGTTYLFAHSVANRVDFVRYNAVFYLLDKLETGDTVEIVYRGKLYRYQIQEKLILAANDVRYLRPQSEEEMLVLQTCYPPGTTWKRLLVIGGRI